MRFFIIFIIGLSVYGCTEKSGGFGIVTPPSANITESLYKNLLFKLTGKDFFPINSAKLTYRCNNLLCLNPEDCTSPMPERYFCNENDAFVSPVLMVSSYKNFNTLKDVEAPLIEKESAAFDLHLKRKDFTAYYDLNSDNNREALRYLLRNEKKLIMSPWLKSLNCKSFNFIKLIVNPEMAKTTLNKVRFERINNKLFLKIFSNEDVLIEIDESSNEMKYLTLANGQKSDWVNLYSAQVINLRSKKIAPLNYCEIALKK